MPEPKDGRSMREATQDLGVHYKAWKDNEKAKNKDKDRFFALVNDAMYDMEPEEILYEVIGQGMSEGRAIERAEKYNPRFTVDTIRESDNGWEAIMVERIEYMSHAYVNVNDGMVYQRQVIDGGQLLDDERMAEEDPVLYAEVTFELPWGERIVRPLDTLEPFNLAAVQQYVYRGKPTVKLPAPRKASDEELESVDA